MSQLIIFSYVEMSALVVPVLSKDLCLAKGHSEVKLVRLEPAPPRP